MQPNTEYARKRKIGSSTNNLSHTFILGLGLLGVKYIYKKEIVTSTNFSHSRVLVVKHLYIISLF